MKEKSRISLVVIGHVDAGKSTTTGHLIYKCGTIDARALAKLAQEAKDLGKESFQFAFVMDKMKASRERGVTIDISLSRFETLSKAITVIDAPGHRDFIKNMISGTSQADAALLIVSAASGEFEAGISKNGATREHLLLAYTLGVRQLIVAVNKMDVDSVGFKESRFLEVKSEMMNILKKIGFNAEKVPFVPIVGFAGDNLTEPSKNLSGWYNGPTLIDAIDSLETPKRPIDKPLRLPVQDVFTIPGIGIVVTGRVESGVLKPGMTIKVAPSNSSGDIRSVEMHHNSVSDAFPGDNVGCNVRGISAKEMKRGSVIGNSKDDPPMEAVSFVAQIIVISHQNEIRAGYCPIIDCGTSHVACKFEKLIAKVNKRDGKVIEENPEFIKNGDSAMVQFVPTKPLVVETYAEFPSLGRFAVRDSNCTVAVGIVKEVTKRVSIVAKGGKVNKS